MNKISFLTLFTCTVLLWSCKSDDPTPNSDDTSTTTETDLLRIQPSIVEELNFIVSYEKDDSLSEGYLISSNGKVTKFEFKTPITTSLSPGSYESIVNYFIDAEKEALTDVLASNVTAANSTALNLMNENDKIINDTTVISASAEGKGSCQIYHVQKSDEGVSPVEYFPIRILEGTYDNSWIVKDSDLPASLLNQIDSILSVDSGLDMDFWGHYIVNSETKT